MLNLHSGHLGGKRDALDARDFAYDASEGNRGKAHVDLRHLCGAVYDQLPLHSCSAHALVSLLEFVANAEQRTIEPPSRLFLYYNERKLEGTLPADDGATLRSGLKTLASLGVCAEPLWPYDVTRVALEPTADCYSSAESMRAVRYFRIAQDIDRLRACLAEGYGFVFGIEAYLEGFTAASKSGVLPMPAPGGTLVGGHALLAVGYDDANKTFEALNSLGSTFGDNGFLTLPYAYLTNPKLSYDFWTIRASSKALRAPGTPCV